MLSLMDELVLGPGCYGILNWQFDCCGFFPYLQMIKISCQTVITLAGPITPLL